MTSKTLWNQTQDRPVVKDLKIASTTIERMRGLLGTKMLPEDQALWILSCRSVHTFFMQYPIDCVFLDGKMKIKSLVSEVVPGRVVWPRWGVQSVIEMRSGSIRKLGLRQGDQLHVGN